MRRRYTGDPLVLGSSPMEAHSLGVGDSFDEVVEELAAVALTTLVGVLALTLQDGDELRSGFEEPAPLADALEGATEEGGSRAVTVGQQSTMVRARLLVARTPRRRQGRRWSVRSTRPRPPRSP